MSVRKLKSEMAPLTRELATRFAKMKPLLGERVFNKDHARKIIYWLKDGEFNSPTWATVKVPGEADVLRANGQHTSTILSTCTSDLFPKNLSVTIDTYEIDDVKVDGPKLFDLFDNPICSRSNSDKMGLYTVEWEELSGIERMFLVNVGKGIDYHRREIVATKEGPDLPLIYPSRDHGLYYREEENRVFASWLHQWDAAKNHWMLRKPGLVAEMLTDWNADAGTAWKFWSELFTDSNPDPEAETRLLSELLKDWNRKIPAPKQPRYRTRTHKTWERYRRDTNKAA